LTRPKQSHDQDKPTRPPKDHTLQETWEQAMSNLATSIAAIEQLPALAEDDDPLDITTHHRAMLSGATWKLAGVQTRLFTIDVHNETEAAQPESVKERLDELHAEASQAALENIDDDAPKH
jgi:hypothetical protein